MHIEAGRVSGVGTAGTTISFATAFTATFHSEGDYAWFAMGFSATNSAEERGVQVSAQSVNSITFKATAPDTVIRWVVVGRTQ